MKCNLCGYKFDEKESLQVCRGCPFIKKCALIKCPNCGYEWPKEPAWLEKIKKGEKR